MSDNLLFYLGGLSVGLIGGFLTALIFMRPRKCRCHTGRVSD